MHARPFVASRTGVSFRVKLWNSNGIFDNRNVEDYDIITLISYGKHALRTYSNFSSSKL